MRHILALFQICIILSNCFPVNNQKCITFIMMVTLVFFELILFLIFLQFTAIAFQLVGMIDCCLHWDKCYIIMLITLQRVWQCDVC